MTSHEVYIRRCFDLARQGAQSASPNPMVGSVLVSGDRIIGEGFHVRRGQPHAEVNAVSSVTKADRHLIASSTLYVSLEPCCFQGLTPACTDLIRRERIPKVVISTTDPSERVSGHGIEILRQNGVEVITGILERQGRELIRDFTIPSTQERPFVQLKFVQSADLYIGHPEKQVWLSNAYEKIMVHKMRSEADAIMVGTNTVICDDPQLTTRNYSGKSPIRVTFDRTLRVPVDSKIFDGSVKTIVYTEQSSYPDFPDTEFVTLNFDDSMLVSALSDLKSRGVHSLMVEGGSRLIEALDRQGLWDEAWVVTTSHKLGEGVKAPSLDGYLINKFELESDSIRIFSRTPL